MFISVSSRASSFRHQFYRLFNQNSLRIGVYRTLQATPRRPKGHNRRRERDSHIRVHSGHAPRTMSPASLRAALQAHASTHNRERNQPIWHVYV